MKKVILSLATIASFGVANAQKMGDLFVYGNIGYTDHKEEISGSGASATTDHQRQFNFAPGIGYQISRNIGIGLAGDIVAYKNTLPGITGETGDKYSKTYIGPFIRYTQPLSPMFFLYGQLNAQYVRTDRTQLANGTKIGEREGNGFSVNVMPAVGVNISRSIALVGSFGKLGYESVTANAPSGGQDYTTSEIEATFGNNFALGIQWNIGGRPHVHGRNRVEPMSETRRMDRYRDNDDDKNEDNDRREAPRRRRMDRRD